MFDFLKRKMELIMLPTSQTIATRHIDGIEKIYNPLTLRIINKLTSYIIGSGYNIEFEGSKNYESYEKWAINHNVSNIIYEAVRNSLVFKEGVMIYLVGGEVDKPINKVEAINYFNAGFLKTVKKSSSECLNVGYHTIQYQGKVNDKIAVIDDSRLGLVRFFENSFISGIEPYTEAVTRVVENIGRLLDKETTLIYKSTFHNNSEVKKDTKQIEEWSKALNKIREKMKLGNIALIPKSDEIVNFTSGSSNSISAVFPVLKDILSATSGIPKSILFGESQSGLNTGAGKERDHENFMRDVRGYQEKLKPVIKKIVDGYLGRRKVNYDIHFNEPMPLSQEDTVNIDTTWNDGLGRLYNLNVIDDDVAKENLRGIK